MEISAKLVKELREKTGAGILDAKKALVENEGNMEKAIEFLRQKGIASADKKMGRIAAEGVVATKIDENAGAMIEVNCETDFVAKNKDFQEFAQNICSCVLKSESNNIDEFIKSKCPIDESKLVEDIVKEKIAVIGEKITLRRFVKYEGNVSTYVHHNKIGVLLLTDSKNDELTKDLCLHIASNAPEFISRDDIPNEVIEEETRIEMGKEDLASKPEQIRQKIVEGRVNKLMSQKCLLEQPFVKNPDVTIGQLIEGKLQVLKFSRFELGEGLEKKDCSNFAQEVMDQINKKD